MPGQGIRGTVEGKSVVVGNMALMRTVGAFESKATIANS